MDIGRLLAKTFGVRRLPHRRVAKAEFDVQAKPMINEMTADEIRALLKLEPHATCGFVRVTFISET